MINSNASGFTEAQRAELQQMIREGLAAFNQPLTLDNNPCAVLKSGQQLENCTDNTLTVMPSEMNGGLQMAQSKYRQRVSLTDAHGNHIEKWACGNTQEEFQRAIVAIYQENGMFNPTPPMQQNERHWDEYVWEWFETYKKPNYRSTKTATTRACFIKNYVVPAFGDKAISSITRKDVADALNRNQHLSKSYMRDIMNYMNAVFKAAVEEELISKNPMDSDLIKNPCKRKRPRKALTPAQKADIIQHIPNIKKPTDQAFMAFLMYTALRPGEIFALQWSDIDLEGNWIHVLRGSSFDKGKILMGEDGETKTGEDGVRDVPLHEGLKQYLLPLIGEGPVLQRDARGHEGEPFTEQTAKRMWQRIAKQVDVHGMTPYVGRHTYLTELAHSGVPLDIVRQISGHKDERMLSRFYLHANLEDVRMAGNAMDSFLGTLNTGT